MFGHVITPRAEEVAPAGPEKAAPEGAEAAEPGSISLIGLDMTQARIVPLTFDELTVEEVRDIMDRMPKNEPSISWMMIDYQLTERPDTFAFKTRDGSVGVLQVEAAEKEAGKLTVRYRLRPGIDRRNQSLRRIARVRLVVRKSCLYLNSLHLHQASPLTGQPPI